MSTVLHLAFILVLALVTLSDAHHFRIVSNQATLVGGQGDESEGLEQSSLEPAEQEGEAVKGSDDLLRPGALSPGGDATPALLPSASTIDIPFVPLAIPERPGSGPGTAGPPHGGLGESIGKALSGRMSAATRARLVASGGGTAESEQAVARALEWLSQHQETDGSWHFDIQSAPQCHGQCKNSGAMSANIASTAMALLPFLGAGETHLEGKYKDNVYMGLHFLKKSMGTDGSLWEPMGTMYGQGLASMALCEAYTMTHDPSLRGAAQKATDFNVAAQDQSGGGWRYNPGMPGDVSVFGWELMAVKSASMAYLKVPEHTFRKANYFLDSMQFDDGAKYGYFQGRIRGGFRGARIDRPHSVGSLGSATSPIGLLCRMYLGWKRQAPGLVEGVKRLSEQGPRIIRHADPPKDPQIDPQMAPEVGPQNEPPTEGPTASRRRHISPALRNHVNMYYNYYATQVMHHYGGEQWTKWNTEMRDFLIATQSTEGHEYGSWFFRGAADMGGGLADTDGGTAGRLYYTSLATMTLEVYYRHMPLYHEMSLKDPFQ